MLTIPEQTSTKVIYKHDTMTVEMRKLAASTANILYSRGARLRDNLLSMTTKESGFVRDHELQLAHNTYIFARQSYLYICISVYLYTLAQARCARKNRPTLNPPYLDRSTCRGRNPHVISVPFPHSPGRSTRLRGSYSTPVKITLPNPPLHARCSPNSPW